MKVQQIRPDKNCSACRGDGYLCERSDVIPALTNAAFPELCSCVEGRVEGDTDVVHLIDSAGDVSFESIMIGYPCGCGGYAVKLAYGVFWCDACYTDETQARAASFIGA